MPRYPKRHTQQVVAAINYFGFFEVNMGALSELIKMKTRGTEVSPADCGQRIRIAKNEDFPERGLQWTPDVIAREIVKIVNREVFLHIAKIDQACEDILSKASSDAENSSTTCADYRTQYPNVPLAVLKNENNEVRAAAMKEFDSMAADDRVYEYVKLPPNGPSTPAPWTEQSDPRGMTGDRSRLPTDPPQLNVPRPWPWKEDAVDTVLSSENLQQSPNPFRQ